MVWLSLIVDYTMWGSLEQAKKEKDEFAYKFDYDDIVEVI